MGLPYNPVATRGARTAQTLVKFISQTTPMTTLLTTLGVYTQVKEYQDNVYPKRRKMK
jgi:hypothetical protein